MLLVPLVLLDQVVPQGRLVLRDQQVFLVPLEHLARVGRLALLAILAIPDLRVTLGRQVVLDLLVRLGRQGLLVLQVLLEILAQLGIQVLRGTLVLLVQLGLLAPLVLADPLGSILTPLIKTGKTIAAKAWCEARPGTARSRAASSATPG